MFRRTIPASASTGLLPAPPPAKNRQAHKATAATRLCTRSVLHALWSAPTAARTLCLSSVHFERRLRRDTLKRDCFDGTASNETAPTGPCTLKPAPTGLCDLAEDTGGRSSPAHPVSSSSCFDGTPSSSPVHPVPAAPQFTLYPPTRFPPHQVRV